MFCFIHELPLKTTLKDHKILNIRLNIARKIYNAVLGECLKRLKLAKESKLWQKAKKSKGSKRSKLYKTALKNQGFLEYDLHKFVKKLRKSTYLEKHIDSSTGCTNSFCFGEP